MIDAAPIEARFSVEHPAWRRGAEIPLRLTITGRGTQPVAVLLPRIDSASLRIVATGGPAEPVPFVDLHGEGLARELHVAPGETVSAEYPLNGRVRLLASGRYTIHCTVTIEYRASHSDATVWQHADFDDAIELEVTG